MLDVGGNEFEMLLLVLEAERDSADGFVRDRLARILTQERADRCIDVSAIGEDLVEGGTGEGGAKLLLRHVTEGVVVAVEEPLKVRMEGLVVGEKVAKDEGLEEPRGVSEVPFDGARLRTGLHHHVFGRQRGTEVRGGLANGLKSGKEGGTGEGTYVRDDGGGGCH